MTQNGQPDNARSARYILKDFVNGKLLYCVAPPNFDQSQFHLFPPSQRKIRSIEQLPPRAIRAARTTQPVNEAIDKAFFQSNTNGVHVRGKVCITNPFKT